MDSVKQELTGRSYPIGRLQCPYWGCLQVSLAKFELDEEDARISLKRHLYRRISGRLGKKIHIQQRVSFPPDPHDKLF